MNQKEVAHIIDAAENNSSWWHYIIPPCITTALIALFYYPSLHYAFQFDDIANITKHFDIRHNTLSSLFLSGTRWISYWINAIHYSIGGFDPFSYRVGNVIIHATNSMLVFLLLFLSLRNLQKKSFFTQNAFVLSFLTSLFFALHPVQTQTVSYVIQGQLEGLSTLAMLSMMLSFMAAHIATSRIMQGFWYTLLFSSAFLSCGTKEIAIISPALLLLMDWFFIAQGNWNNLKKRMLLHAALTCFIVGLYMWLLKPQFFIEILGLQKVVRNNIGNVITQAPNDFITPWSFFVSQFKVNLHYIWIFLWPFDISVEYDWMLSRGLLAPDSFLPLLVLLGIGYILVRILKHNKTSPIAFGALWFFFCILPRASIIPSPELLVDYKTYMASIGWFFILASGFIVVLGLTSKQIVVLNNFFTKYTYGNIAVSLLLAIPLGLCTMHRNVIWSSGLAFWDNMIKNAPLKARAYNNYGVEVSQVLRKFEDAIPYFKKAINMDKNYPDPWNNLAVAYANLNKVDLAIEALKEGIKINPYSPEGYNNIASFYLQKKELDKAEKALATALKLRPHYGKAHFNLGRVLTERGQTEQAWECFKNCCTKADFDVDHGFATYAQASFHLKKFDDAIFAYEKVMQLNPEYPGAIFNLGNAYFMKGNYEKALVQYQRIPSNNPQYQQAIFNVGETYFTMQKFGEALSWFNKLDGIKKQLPQLYLRTAQCLEKLGNIQEARNVLLELVSLDNKPEDPMYTQLKETGRTILAQFEGVYSNVLPKG